MRFSLRSGLLLSAAFLLGACAEEPQGTEGSSDVTRALLQQPAGDGMSTPIAADESLVADDAPRISVADVGFNRGSVDAPIKIVEMSDYGCSFCRKFHEESFPTLRTQFIESGMVEWKFVPYVTGMFGNSLPATEAAECAFAQSTSAFEAINSRLWNEQSVWKESDTPESTVRQWVTDLDLDMAAFDACVAEDQQVPRIAASTTLARQIGVRGTPTIIIIGWPPVQGALPLSMFQELIMAAYAQATTEGAGPE